MYHLIFNQLNISFQPHDLGDLQLKPKKEKKKMEKTQIQDKPIMRKNSTSIIQLLPPPPKVS